MSRSLSLSAASYIRGAVPSGTMLTPITIDFADCVENNLLLGKLTSGTYKYYKIGAALTSAELMEQSMVGSDSVWMYPITISADGSVTMSAESRLVVEKGVSFPESIQYMWKIKLPAVPSGGAGSAAAAPSGAAGVKSYYAPEPVKSYYDPRTWGTRGGRKRTRHHRKQKQKRTRKHHSRRR